MSELAEASDDDMAAVSRAVSELRDHYLAELDNRGRENRYRAKGVLTKLGRQTAASVNEKAERAVACGGSSLTEEERAAFYKALTAIAADLSEYTEKLEAEKKENG